MWQEIFFLFLLFILYRLYKSIYKPYRLYCSTKELVSRTKYNVGHLGFFPYLSKYILQFILSYNKYRDASYSFKKIYSQNDLLIGNLSDRVLFVLIDPSLTKQFYIKEGTNTYVKYQPFVTNVRRLLGNSLILNKNWSGKRKQMTSFFTFNRIKNKYLTISGITQQKLNSLEKTEGKLTINLLNFAIQLTSSVILNFFFGGDQKDLDSLQIQGEKMSLFLCQLIDDVAQQNKSLVNLMLGPQYLKWGLTAFDRKVNFKLKKFIKSCKYFIQNRILEIQEGKKNEEKQQDYIEKFYENFDKKELNEDFFTEIIYDFILLILAGTDTNANSLMMLLYYCSLHPNVMQKLKQEIDENIKTEEDYCYDVMKKMVYLDAVFLETLRYYSPTVSTLFRQATEDHYLGELPVKKGTLFTISNTCANNSSKSYQQPLQFRPERWIKEDGSIRNPEPYTWLSFSAGPRSCVGKQLAETQIKIFASHILKEYDVKVENSDLKMKLIGFIYKSENQMVTLEKRQNHH